MFPESQMLQTAHRKGESERLLFAHAGTIPGRSASLDDAFLKNDRGAPFLLKVRSAFERTAWAFPIHFEEMGGGSSQSARNQPSMIFKRSIIF